MFGEMRSVADAARHAAPIDRTIAVLALAASADPRAFTRAADGRAMVGGRILRLVVATMLNGTSSPEPLHLQIAKAWAPDNKRAADLIRRALVLLADHELNASTFTVRCAASTGLNLYDAMIAGLVALKGPRHGGAGVLAAQLVKTLVDRDVAPVIRERVALGERSRLRSRRQARRSARTPCWQPWRGPARRSSPPRFRSGSSKRPANSSISTTRWRCWCIRWAAAWRRTGAVCGRGRRMDRACAARAAAGGLIRARAGRSSAGAQPGFQQGGIFKI
jgi:hypothetical protein